MIFSESPFVLSASKGERRIFQRPGAVSGHIVDAVRAGPEASAAGRPRPPSHEP